MKFATPLERGTLTKRYKRFLTDVVLDDGQAITASCPNTGSMMGLIDPGNPVWLSTSDNPKRKYRHTWELVEVTTGNGTTLVGLNTGRPNAIVTQAIKDGAIAELAGYANLRNEVKYGTNSRIDILLEDDARPPCYVEVKNVTLLRRPGVAEFPDGVTARGAKHLAEMSDMVKQGARAVMCYLVQRADADSLTFASDIDPAYLEAYKNARDVGVEAIAYSCSLSPHEITIAGSLPISIDG
ncbi:MAG: DNA/RNA nuclease SfsA [Aestuariivirgaceae bacterium]